MNGFHFDRETRGIPGLETRRALLVRVGALSLFGALSTLFGQATKAGNKENGRQARNHHQHKRRHKRSRHKKHTRTCTPAGGTPSIEQPCCEGLVAVDNACQPCDVCASGCPSNSVQDAIASATPDSTLLICAGRFLETISIDKNLTLIGVGDGDDPVANTLLDANGGGTVVTIDSATVRLKQLRLTGGAHSGYVGGLFNSDGTLTMTNCTVADNTDGGVLNYGTLTMTDCTVNGNTTIDNCGGIGNGEGTVMLTRCAVHENTALSGGGLCNEFGAVLVLTDCTVRENTANLYGGGIMGDGKLTLDATEVTQNTARHKGGGIFSDLYCDTALTNGSSVSNNRALDPSLSGGGIYNAGTLDPSGGTIIHNSPDNCVNASGGTGCP